MQTTPETEALLEELYERSEIVLELDGPQIEAWVSGLFDVFDESVTAQDFVTFCASKETLLGLTLCRAVSALTDGQLADHAREVSTTVSIDLPPRVAQIGESQPDAAWVVEAPFGRSVVIGFMNPVVVIAVDEEPEDTAHSLLVELDEDGRVEDLLLAGPPRALLAEAAAADDRVTVREIAIEEATSLIVDAWPQPELVDARFGPGVSANQQFVRRRMADMTGTWLPAIATGAEQIDVRRGLDDHDFAEANRAALSTLQAAVGVAPTSPDRELGALEAAWVGVIRGDGGDLSSRERDALLWLEWADWLGAGIGLLRAGAGATVSGDALVDYVNRCPEVSSSIDKADRDYAEWAFDTAVDLLNDAGVTDKGLLTKSGFEALAVGLVAAWS